MATPDTVLANPNLTIYNTYLKDGKGPWTDGEKATYTVSEKDSNGVVRITFEALTGLDKHPTEGPMDGAEESKMGYWLGIGVRHIESAEYYAGWSENDPTELASDAQQADLDGTQKLDGTTPDGEDKDFYNTYYFDVPSRSAC